MALTLHVADTLTGRIVGRLPWSEFELPDPWTGAGAGAIKVPLPNPTGIASMVDRTTALLRWVAVEDDRGRFLWSGPITARPGRDGGEIAIPVADWRTWFYAAYLRPGDDGSRGDYIVKDTEQATIARALALSALDAVGAPAMVVDDFDATGVTRDRTLLQLDQSIGDSLDGLSAQHTRDGIEWWVSCSRDPADSRRLVPHVRFAYPERQTRTIPISLRWQLGKGGNISQVSWPTGTTRPTRVWATGQGQPPDQPYASDEDLDIADGTQVLWETLLGNLDGVVKSKRCFEYASAALDYYEGQSGQFECDVPDDVIPLGDYATGDRARLVYDDGWDAVDLEAVRITQRVLSGKRGEPTRARLTLDLANNGYGDTGATPGEAVTDDGST